MQASAGVLAVVPTTHHGGLLKHATTHHHAAGHVETPPTPNVAKNPKSHPKVVSTIVGKLKDLQEVVECDPQDERLLKNQDPVDDSSSAGRDDDIGILSSSCGVGRECQEGSCVDVEEWTHLRRDLQQNVDVAANMTATVNSSIMEDMQYACDFGGLVGYDCACDFDTGSYTGTATCTTPLQCNSDTSVCGVDVTDCSQTTYTLFLKGTPGVIDSEMCLQFLEPYAQIACYTTSTLDFGETTVPECTLSLNGEECTSCDVYKYGEGNCYNFNCGNTALAGNGRGSMVGNTCALPAHSVGLFLDTYGCPACDLCGDGMTMTSPSSSMVLFNQTYDCAYVEDVASQGFFTTDSCNYFAAIAREPCACVATADEMATANPTTLVIQNTGPCEICPGGSLNPDGVIFMPGSQDIVCSEVEEAGMDGSIVGDELCKAVQEQAAGPCCGVVTDGDVGEDAPAEEMCTLCGYGKIETIPSAQVMVPTQGIFSCEDLKMMGEEGVLDENGICLLVQLSARTPCGCVADGPTMSPTMLDAEAEVDTSPSGAAVRTSLAAVAVASAMAMLASCLF